jgi:vacuolar-type H+-ATPase subunit H
MRLPIISIIGSAILALAAGCDHAKSPQAAANDIAAAKQSAAQEVSDAHQEAAKEINSASKELQDKSSELADSNAKAAYDVALARADGDHKIAIQECMTHEGDGQKVCKDRADAHYDAAKENAKASRAAQQR